ncbi:MAG: dioxygenase [Alphaproteobacteria bacterium]|nr:dioxygenase [Alphaproteobacteria bacterium]
MLPALFVSHGAPTLPFDDVPAREFLRRVDSGFEPPLAILTVSAHWETDVPSVNAVVRNETIHDFQGFPPPLYRLHYPAPGAPELAGRIASLLKEKGVNVCIDRNRGLDHGAWVPLMLAYPAATIPVLQLSVQPRADAAHHIALGQALAPLRDEGVLILGSGSFVHNLQALEWRGGREPEWSRNFAAWMHEALVEGRDRDLENWRARAPDAAKAHPTDEHLLPLFVAYGAGGPPAVRLHDSVMFGTLRMDAYRFG